MPEIFFTADHHFGHLNIIKHCKRTFADVDEMTEELVDRWNAVVGPHDDVWHLGDFAYRLRPEALERVFRRLNGRKHLIVGNHDDKHTLRLPWSSEPKDRRAVKVPGEALPVICDHYAMRTWPKSHYGAVHLYGHSHGALPGVGRSVDVGVDVWDFRPVTLAELRPTLERQHEEFERQREAHRLFRERAARGDPAAALAILRRVPDVAPEPGDEVQPYAKPMAGDEQAQTFAALWKGNRDAAAAGVGYGARVVEDPGVMSGEPCVSGTRVPARKVLAYLKAGHSDIEIFADYPSLPVDGIAAVRRWATALGLGLPEDGGDGRGK